MPKRTRLDVTPNQQLDELNKYSPVIVKYDITADATGGVTMLTAPFAMQILDFTVLAQATSASGTVTPRKATNAMCTAITMATDGSVARMTAGAVVANAARLILAKGDTVTLVTNGANDRGIVTLIGVRV